MDFFSLQNSIALLSTYKYAVLFPLSIIEGPIVTVIAGFLSSLHLLSLPIIYAVVICGDLIGDTLFYSLGRFGGTRYTKWGHYIGITEAKLETAKTLFTEHHNKTIVTAKLVHGIGASGLVVAGILKMPYVRFMQTCIAISFVQSAFFLTIGYVFGYAYEKIGLYVDYFAITISSIALAVLLFVIFMIVKRSKSTMV